MEKEDRYRVVFALQDGMSYTDIEKKWGYTRQFIAHWAKRYRETGGVDDAPRSGRPMTLSDAQTKAAIRSLKRKATGSLRKTAKKMRTDHGVVVTKNTIANVAKREGLVYRLRHPKPLLTERDKLARLRFARLRRPRGYWRRVVWTDETSFAVFSSTKGEWVPTGTLAAPRETVKWPPRIRVWAGISAMGKTSLVRIPKSLKAGAFEKLMKEELLPQIRDIYDGDPTAFVLMQDGDGTHTAKRVQKMLVDEGVEQLLPWPAHSPDLNPIENAWSMVERHLEKVNPSTERGLWKAMKEGWEKIDHASLVRLTGSLPRRLAAVKEAQGGHTKY